jgi:hypothetical protein
VQNRSEVRLYPPPCFHREAIDQKFSRKEGVRANQLMNAIAVAVSKLPQWFSPHMFRSLSIKTVMPADEHAAPKVSAAVIYQETTMVTILDFTQAKTMCTHFSRTNLKCSKNAISFNCHNLSMLFFLSHSKIS